LHTQPMPPQPAKAIAQKGDWDEITRDSGEEPFSL